MQTITDSQEKEWGIRLNESVWNPVKDWPEWTNRSQQDSWTKRGVILWSKETRMITRLKGWHALGILAQLRDNPERLQQGCVVGEPVWEFSLNVPDDKGKPTLANQMVLSPEQTMALLNSLEQEEEVLKQMADEEEADRKRALAQVYDILFELAERGKHTIYDESLSREENMHVMRQRWESGEFPKELTWTERKLFNDVLKEISAERQREELKRQERARRTRKNLSTHHFFWERLKGVWSYFRPDERLHILQLLRDKEWDERTLAEVRQIIENAQFFAGLSEKTGIVEEPQKVTGEELRLIIDLPDEALWDELMELY